MAPSALMRRLQGKRIVGKTAAPDGTKAVVVQTREWGATFAGRGPKYSTFLYVKKPNEKWRGFYGEFKDDKWSRGDFEAAPNAERVVIYRKNVPAITYYWATEKFILRNRPEYDGAPFDVVPTYDPLN